MYRNVVDQSIPFNVIFDVSKTKPNPHLSHFLCILSRAHPTLQPTIIYSILDHAIIPIIDHTVSVCTMCKWPKDEEGEKKDAKSISSVDDDDEENVIEDVNGAATTTIASVVMTTSTDGGVGSTVRPPAQTMTTTESTTITTTPTIVDTTQTMTTARYSSSSSGQVTTIATDVDNVHTIILHLFTLFFWKSFAYYDVDVLFDLIGLLNFWEIDF